ncbi:MAG: hypothetical protein HC935_04955 [Pseudanabaena sp. SU_2_4]|nr:hypothetical protein [Pseudanabaena sp. SU_2_4]
MLRNSAEYRGDRKQLDALLNLLAELQDRRQTTINVTPMQADVDSVELQSPKTANLPDYLRQLADEAGININIENRVKDLDIHLDEDQIDNKIEEIEDLDAIADSISYIQDLLFGSMPPPPTDPPQPLQPEPSQHSPATPNYTTAQSHHSDTPQESSAESSEALALLQNILVQPEVATLRQSLEQLEQKVVHLEHQVNDPTELEHLDRKLAQLQNQFGDKSEMQNVQAELANLSKQQVNLPTELANLKRQLADLDRKIVSLDRQVNDPTELEHLDRKLADLQNQVGDKSEIQNVQTETG